jgi:hypothetical protein
MAYPIPDLDGFIDEVQDALVPRMRRQLTAAQFVTDRTVEDLGIKEYRWQERTDLDGVRATMEIPDPSQSDQGNIIEHNVELPVFTRDMHYDGRDFLAYQRTGLDTTDAEEAGRIMGEFLNDYFYLGGGLSGEDIPGPDTGLLNNPDRLEVDNTGSSNWENPEDFVNDLAEAIADLGLHRQDPPYVLLADPADMDLFQKVRSETDARATDLLQDDMIRGPVFDEVVTGTRDEDGNSQTGEMFLFKASSDNYDWVTPFSGFGDVRRVTEEGEDLMGQGLWVRWLTAGAPRVIRGDSVCRVVGDRS